MKLKFDEAKEIFESYKVWSGNKELFWYQKAWKALDKGGLTLYKNSIERSLVIIRVFTLILIYKEFCDLAFGEYCAYEFPDWEDASGLNAFKLGEIVGASKELGIYIDCDDFDDEYWDYYYDKYGYDTGYNMALDDILLELVLSQRYIVFDCLAENIGDTRQGAEFTIFVSMYLATITMAEDEEDMDIDNIDELQNNNVLLDTEELSDYERYEREIDKYYEEIFEICENSDALNWIYERTYIIHV